MNHLMWGNAATQANMELLIGRGVRVLGPGSGEQACGEYWSWAHARAGEIVECDRAAAAPDGPLRGRRVLVTAGTTRECIDPVRFVSNRSSGKMGFAVAQAMREAGADVVLVTGPVCLATPPGVQRVDVESCEQMDAAVQRALPGTAIFIGTAAVADYRPVVCAEQKIKKTQRHARLSS